MTRRILVAGTCLLLILLSVWQAGRIALRHYLEADRQRAETALRLTTGAMTGYLARYEVAPDLLAALDQVRALAADPANPARTAEINAMLTERNAALQASEIYVIGRDGVTLAASNHDRPDSFVGQNFSYRPYFQDAISGRLARFYGIGTTSGLRGYYFSAPIRRGGDILGVVTVKIGLDALEESWSGSEYRIFVTDPEGVVFMSSVPEWLYGGLMPLTPDRVAREEASRRYAGERLFPLPLTRQSVAGVETLREAGGRRNDYTAVAQVSSDAGWQVHVLLDSASARAQAALAALATGLLLCLLLSAAMVIRQRSAGQRERLALQERARAHLEQRVARRTSALNAANLRLEAEIAERRETENELRRTQASLVQAGKLAALGQMAAALSHELNQPLAAARNYADNAMTLIDRQDLPRARDNVGRIYALVDRMTSIGQHLRNVARNPEEKLAPVDLAPLMDETRAIVAPRLEAAGAVLEVEIAPDLPALRAGATRLQQVLVNLIGNAADAATEAEDRRIHLTAHLEEGLAIIRVRDHGPGVPAAIIDRIFDPFFTTKRVGAGLGLGLSISYNIVKDFGGDLRVTDTGHGAEFAVILNVAERRGAAA
ncbi:sensor histidine kinase [Haematobacter genomosp. 1]|uniref:C4-dicarboxylate transport sensor protein DctB n=1 Tax=Haematobacter genomosp. 1 TaxID=366618 RepID=A0A212A9S4_9RHOB|nr:ATP-binding protein [Haematobacter genomosp. 1]OWJ76863.1 two-component sensor histidine kinase [Haematobacter genomosp. 1]